MYFSFIKTSRYVLAVENLSPKHDCRAKTLELT